MAEGEDSSVDGRSLRYQDRRDQLLRSMTDYVLDNGIGDLSLRTAASAIGVSHSSLLRHFDTKEALIDNVIERLCDDLLERASAARSLDPAQALQELWDDLRRPEQRRQFLVLFEVVATSARTGPRPRLADALVGRLLEAIAAELRANGLTTSEATMTATCILAAIRGLQLDLAVTDDADRVDDAVGLLGRLLGSMLREPD